MELSADQRDALGRVRSSIEEELESLEGTRYGASLAGWLDFVKESEPDEGALRSA